MAYVELIHTLEIKCTSRRHHALPERLHTPSELNSTPFSVYLPVTEGPDSHGLRSRARGSLCVTTRAWGIGLGLSFPTAPVYFRHLSRSGLLSTITLSISKGV